jgi:dihydrolipoamide dehydrogenase
MAPQMLPGADPELAEVLQREFRRKGIEVRLNTRFEGVEKAGEGVRVAVASEKGADAIEADQVLVAIGRRPLSADLGLERAGVNVTSRGFVEVDARGRTAAPGVLAIGDLVGGALLAHKASEEGIAAVELLAGVRTQPLDHAAIPSCIYAQPQVAWVGLTEAQARDRFGDDLRVGRFPFTASGKALAAAHTAGFVKILAEPRYGQIVGAHVVGHGATELVAEVGLALTLEATTSEIAATCHAHPTLSEAILEAALSAEGRSLNL